MDGYLFTLQWTPKKDLFARYRAPKALYNDTYVAPAVLGWFWWDRGVGPWGDRGFVLIGLALRCFFFVFGLPSSNFWEEDMFLRAHPSSRLGSGADARHCHQEGSSCLSLFERPGWNDKVFAQGAKPPKDVIRSWSISWTPCTLISHHASVFF